MSGKNTYRTSTFFWKKFVNLPVNQNFKIEDIEKFKKNKEYESDVVYYI